MESTIQNLTPVPGVTLERRPIGKQGQFKTYIYVECICSKLLWVQLPNWKNNHTRSCGCVHRENVKKHNDSKKHDYLGHPIYTAWHHIKSKHRGKNYKYYESGCVSDEWLKFKSFLSWSLPQWKQGYTLARFNITKQYKPDNCAWLSRDDFSHDNNMAKHMDTCIKKYGVAHPRPQFKTENQLREWLNYFGDLWISNSKLLGNREIDCYCENKLIGLEYSGVFWHSDICWPKDSMAHFKKYKDCLDKGIRLFNIFSDEWTNRQNQIKNHFKRELGYCDRKVNAASCSIRELDKEVAVQFYNYNALRPIDSSRKVYKSFGVFTNKNESLCCLIYMDYGDKVRLLRPAYLDDVVIRNIQKLTKTISLDKLVFAKTDNRLDSNWPERDFGFAFQGDEKPKFRYVRSGKEERYIEKPKNVKTGKIYNAGRKVWLLSPTPN